MLMGFAPESDIVQVSLWQVKRVEGNKIYGGV